MNPDRLYERLPSLYRERDVEEGFPLRALLRIVTSQADLLDRDIERLYDDFFIETCRPWVIPYIGDLVGADTLFDATRSDAGRLAAELFEDLTGRDLRPPLAARSRTDVAKTISYRRRKGTLAMLEELARDVTGWSAHAVEFTDLVGWTQHREHHRPTARWADVRSVEAMGRVDGPFDQTSHTVDVRRPTQSAGWHHHRHIGFFLWRLAAFPLEDVPARQDDEPWRYHFSPLGQRAPLFSRRRREGDEAGLATELHVPGPIRPERFWDDLERHRETAPRPPATELYGETGETSFAIRRNGAAVPPVADPEAAPDAVEPRIVCRRLDPWPDDPPAGQVVAVDVASGRLAIGDGWPDATTAVDVSYHHGFGAAMGGGPYERGAWLVRPELADLRIGVTADGAAPAGAPAVVVASVADALAQWRAAGRPDAIVTILDSRTYALPSLTLRNEGWLAIEAANGERPVLQTAASGAEIDVLQPAREGDPDRRAALTLNGVVLEGFLGVTGDLGRLRILHSTLIPGRRLEPGGQPIGSESAVRVRATSAGTERLNTQLRVELAFSITGGLTVPRHAEGIWVLDSIVDGVEERAIGGPRARPGPPLVVERSTILGATQASALQASESVFAGGVEVERTQQGCARFSFVPAGSRTPRRHRCQPDLAAGAALESALAADPGLGPAARAAIRARVEARVVPSFTARRYGQPAYAQLHLGCARELREGAEDGAEMGAFSHVKHTQRAGNLLRRVEEYLPFGLQPGFIYVT